MLGRNPPFSHPDLFCRGCGTTTVDAPMLRHDLWLQMEALIPRGNAKRDLLCLQCVEKALGRQIGVEDLHNCLGNAFTIIHHERLMAQVERMVLEELLKNTKDDSVLTRLARVAHRSTSEDAAIANTRTALMGILEE